MKLRHLLLLVGLPLGLVASAFPIPNAGAQTLTIPYLFGGNDEDTMAVGRFIPLLYTPPIGFVTLVIPDGYSMLANPLANNGSPFTVAEIFTNQPNGSTVFTMDGSGFKANNYLNGWSDPNMPLPPGEALFFNNPTAAFTNTIVGWVDFGTNQLPSGISACASIVPDDGGLSSILQFPAADGDVVYLFNNVDNTYSNYTYSTFSMSWSPDEPQIMPGQSFWVSKSTATNWGESASPDCPSCPYQNILQPQLVSQVGQVNFFTFNATNAALGVVLDVDGVTPLSGESLGQLYGGTNADESTFVALGAPTVFSTNLPGYIDGGVVSLPFASGGQPIYIQLRAWKQAEGATFEAALANRAVVGESAPLLITAHATIEEGVPGLPPSDVNTFPSFQLAFSPVPFSSGGTGLAAFQITELTMQGNDLLVTWTAPQGTTNIVQATNGEPDGSYATNFLAISPPIIMPGANPMVNVSTNYLDVGGATNSPSRYYRVFVP